MREDEPGGDADPQMCYIKREGGEGEGAEDVEAEEDDGLGEGTLGTEREGGGCGGVEGR